MDLRLFVLLPTIALLWRICLLPARSRTFLIPIVAIFVATFVGTFVAPWSADKGCDKDCDKGVSCSVDSRAQALIFQRRKSRRRLIREFPPARIDLLRGRHSGENEQSVAQRQRFARRQHAGFRKRQRQSVALHAVHTRNPSSAAPVWNGHCHFHPALASFLATPRMNEPSRSPFITRRDALKAVAGAGIAASFSGCASLTGAAARRDLVRRENQNPGTRDWLLEKTRIDPPTKYRCPWIEGYCSHASVRAGETISFHVSTNPASAFTLDLFRLGYYGGDGARHVLSLGPFEGATQADPPVGPKRLRDRTWEPGHALPVPGDWLSGVYLGQLTRGRDGTQSYVIFILRDHRPADF